MKHMVPISMYCRTENKSVPLDITKGSMYDEVKFGEEAGIQNPQGFCMDSEGLYCLSFPAIDGKEEEIFTSFHTVP